MLKRSILVLSMVAVFSGSAMAECPEPYSSPLGDGSNLSWSDWFAEKILDLILGPALPYQPSECTDVEIYFD